MKKIILLLILPVLCGQLLGQQKEKAEKLVEEGIGYHDKGDYEGALKRYDKALELDADNLLALAEKSMTLLAMAKYEEAAQQCERAIQSHPGERGLMNVYVNLGSAYDVLKKTDKSIEVYEDGIRLFPDFFLLHFNKGISLVSVRRLEEALPCFQASAALNPKHPGTQNALARLLAADNRIPAILAFSRFLILEPQSKRSVDNLNILQSLMTQNVEKTGRNSVKISVNAAVLGDTTADGSAKENSFSATDLLLSMEGALDFEKEFKKMTEVERFIRKFDRMCASLKETKNDNHGFYWDYYVPYFIEMKEKNFIETFAYVAFATSDYPEVDKWLKTHEKEIDSFYEWSNQFVWATE